jgi:hypothetical protein
MKRLMNTLIRHSKSAAGVDHNLGHSKACLCLLQNATQKESISFGTGLGD